MGHGELYEYGHQLNTVMWQMLFIREYPKGKNSYLNTVTEIMLVRPDLMCFCIFTIGAILLKEETTVPST